MLQAPLLFVALTFLHGTVTVGPTSPVCRVGKPCTKPAAYTALAFTRAGYVTRRVSTDAAVRFVVPYAATATHNFSFDTGIR